MIDGISPRETWEGGRAWFVLFLGWLPKHGLICGVRSNHVTTTWAVNRIGIRAFCHGLSITFSRTFSRGSSNRSPFVFGSNLTKAKLPGESGEQSHKTWLGPSWDRGHVTRVFETLGNTFLIHEWGFSLLICTNTILMQKWDICVSRSIYRVMWEERSFLRPFWDDQG